MDESKKNKLITLEHVSGLYSDLRGRILSVESELGAEIDGVSEVIENLSNTYATTEALTSGLAAKVSTDSLKNKGNNKTPIYFDANGNATSISYTIEKSVPADAKFTDTTYTAGTGISISNNTVAIDSSVVTISSLTTALANKADKSYVDTELGKKADASSVTDLTSKVDAVSSAFRFKGTTASNPSNSAYALSVSAETAEAGDVWNTSNSVISGGYYIDGSEPAEPGMTVCFKENATWPAGTNFVWVVEEGFGTYNGYWDAMGGTTVNLSNYATKTDLNSYQPAIKGAASTITDSNLTTGRVLVSDGSGKVSTSSITDTELSYLDNVTSNIQSQLNSKASTVHGIHLSDISGGAVGQHLVKQSLTGDIALDYAWQDLNVYSALVIEGWGPALSNAQDATNENIASTVVKRDASGNFSAGTITANLAGTASAATKLTNSRTFSLTGDVSGSANFNGENDCSIAVTVADNSHTHTWSNISDRASCTISTSGTITGSAVYGAVWNDLTDSIEVPGDTDLEPGYAYCFDGEKYYKSTKYMDEGFIGIHSDTSGFNMGKKGNGKELDVAVAGFVLAYVDRVYRPGTPLTVTTDGKLTEMSLQDKIYYPERLVGTFWKSENAEEWGSSERKVPVNGRCWIKVR